MLIYRNKFLFVNEWIVAIDPEKEVRSGVGGHGHPYRFISIFSFHIFGFKHLCSIYALEEIPSLGQSTFPDIRNTPRFSVRARRDEVRSHPNGLDRPRGLAQP